MVPGAGRPDPHEVVRRLGQLRFTNIVVEGGSAVLGSFLDAGLIDEVHVFIAPILAGGDMALSPIGGSGAGKIAEALRLTEIQIADCGGDLYVQGWR
jgi:diaminohydroxyphosphoribosylaminopyrimidine deaminase/5-amino-6-(5-phosphoribosylamino)uracil reductase